MRQTMRRPSHFVLIGALLAICGCAHSVQLVQFETGQVLHGSYNTWTKRVTVTMPDGDDLTGKYKYFANAVTGFGFGSAFGVGPGGSRAAGLGSVATVSESSVANAYALLTSSTSPLVMEIVCVVDAHTGSGGMGTARTNDGRVFRVVFD